MLRVVRKEIERHFYDSTYKGINLDTLFAEAARTIDGVKSNNELFTVIAGVMDEFQESGTYFIPPERIASVDYGWRYLMVGDSCYVTAVKPGSDAERNGLRAGDRLLAIGREVPSRSNDHTIRVLLNILNPQRGIRITVRTEGDHPREVVALAEIRTRKKVLDLSLELGDIDFWDDMRESEEQSFLIRNRNWGLGDSIHVWKIASLKIDVDDVENEIDQAEGKKALILDFRGCSSGYPKTLDYLIGCLFDHSVNVGHFETRGGRKDWMVDVSPRAHFKGLLVIIQDSRTSGAAEVLARLVQLEHRGIVIGDKSRGAVGKGQLIEHDVGTGNSVFYWIGVTTERVLMADGGNLEGAGVQPDELVLPRASDIAEGRDPILSYAAWLVGSQLSPEEAGKLFPTEWMK